MLGDGSQQTLLRLAAPKGQIPCGRIKPLAVTGARRLPELPAVPTVVRLTRDLRATLNRLEV